MMSEVNFWLLHQSSLAILQAETSGRKQEKWVKSMKISPSEVFLFILVIFLHAVRRYDVGYPTFLSLRRKVCCAFIALKSPSGFEAANLSSNGKHANHYTTEAKPSCVGRRPTILWACRAALHMTAAMHLPCVQDMSDVSRGRRVQYIGIWIWRLHHESAVARHMSPSLYLEQSSQLGL
jgi:hypothetical protein